ncbi:ABC transporter permease [Streptomyces sp. M41]|uniref:ABC transporter permease n=1 Tax=Streptomyces sp. M41 TaxID=3059412 RepID=UPI00374DE05A
MTTTAATTKQGYAGSSQPAFHDLLRSEWIKIRTVRSTGWCLALFTLITIGIATLVALNRNADASTGSRVPVDGIVTGGTLGVAAGQLAIVVFAASAIGGEYGSGMIRTSLSAVPWRRRWLAAKALVVALTALAAGAVVNAVSFAVGCVVAPGVSGALMDPGVVRAVLGGGLYLSGLALLTLAVATVVRGTAGAVVTMSALIYVVPFLLLGSGFESVQRFLPVGLGPGSAGWAIMQPGPMLGGLAPWSGFAVLCAWAVVAMTGALYAVEKRDV